MPSREIYDVLIAGAGPVGLFAGILAHNAGLNVRIIEKETAPVKHSRSVGIHPPSLDLFSSSDLLSSPDLIDGFLENGIRINRGRALASHISALGILDFSTLGTPHNFILTIPQWKTESLLENKLRERDPELLVRNATITGIEERSKNGTIDVSLTSQKGTQTTLTSRILLACDGRHSTIRKMAGIPFVGKAYPYRYAMGDFPDNTDFGPDAVIFLTKKGLTECFPLPDGLRRWVVQQTRDHGITDIPSLVNTIQSYCGSGPDSRDCRMFSEFGVERYLADTFWKNRVVLAGDAAHVVSPIGGQGMNLGWLNVADAVREIRSCLQDGDTIEDAASRYTSTAQKRAKRVIRRSEYNMKLGNRGRIPSLRNKLVQLLLNSPAKELLKRRFTMQGL